MSGSSSPSAPLPPSRPLIVVSAVVLAALLLMHAYTVVVRADREPHMDETEYVHAGWLMANGGRLYETFFEHHSPLFFRTLQSLAPIGEAVDVKPFFVRARLLAGACGLVALLALALAFWRIAPEAAPIGVALLIATGNLYTRGFADVRADAFALMFLAGGMALIAASRDVAGAVGVGLVAVSGLWSPKWPLVCVVLALFWLIRARRRLLGIGVAAAVLAVGLLAVRAVVSLDAWWFFNFDVNRVLTRQVITQEGLAAHFEGGRPFYFVPDAFQPAIIVPALILLAAAAVVGRSWLRTLMVVLMLAAFVEVRYVYPWPAIWNHYYLMWSVIAGGVLGLVPSSLAILIRRFTDRERMATVVFAAATSLALLLGLAHVLAVAPVTDDRAPYWGSAKFLRDHLRPGDVVWIEPTRHPVSIRDASYYWFSVRQMIMAAEELRGTARGRRYLPPAEPYPLCPPPANLRYTLDPRRVKLEGANACMQKLVDEGRVRKTVIFDVWQVGLLKSPQSDPVKGVHEP